MISYYEMTAHNCGTVHVPGVAWPEYVYQPPKKQVERKLKPRSFKESKKSILAVLSSGENNSAGINSTLKLSHASLFRCLSELATDGFISHRDTRSSTNCPRRTYFIKDDKCKLH